MQELFRLGVKRDVCCCPAYDLRKYVPRGTQWKSFSLLMLIFSGLLQTSNLFAQKKSPLVHVIFSTDLGDFEVAVDSERAPVTTANFLRYVDAGHYNGGTFHRTVKLDNQPDNKVLIEVVQAGTNPNSGPDFPAITLEGTNKTGITHRDGTISMARDAADTATSDFFICINDQPSLDFGGKRNSDGQGFAAFGHVISGMDVIKKIQASPVDGQKLTPPVPIISAKRKNEVVKSKIGK
ncbi:MAG: peptidyl-prolyl cis-trans isomerase cyclophilin type [Acidobacteriaceae bacterium]|nr:peptidyl-prolyl cis-trans isomerase cyclophilin type [Acidobacteriaceae bacterium]